MFLRSLHVDDLDSGSKNNQKCYNFYNKAKARLRLKWEKQKDNIKFLFKNLVAFIYLCPTKRQPLTSVAPVYHSLDLINPYFPFKIFISNEV